MLHTNLTVNAEGHLCIGGADCVTLAQEHGTPLYVMDENRIRENCRAYRDTLRDEYGDGLICYASKAFSCKEMYRIVSSEGLGTDVVSGGELYTALTAGMPAERIVFHGNSKTNAELEYAVKAGVGRIVCDNFEELERLNAIAGRFGKKVNVLLRVKPGIEAHTHDFIQTGKVDSKFGFGTLDADGTPFSVGGMLSETSEIRNAILKTARAYDNLNLKGLHCHIGSQILDAKPFAEAAKIICAIIGFIAENEGIAMEELNLGGGPGSRYVESDDPQPYAEIIRTILRTVKENWCSSLKKPFIMFEPGRSIVADAGVTLYEVMAKKHIPNTRDYVLVDGGMCDNPRYALYRAEYEAVCANRADAPKTEVVTIGGKCCESGDFIGEQMPLQQTETGDIVAVLSTGAYNYSMASHYNRNPNAEVVMVKDGAARTVVRRETYEDVCRNDI